jgi:hypothetical protein
MAHVFLISSHHCAVPLSEAEHFVRPASTAVDDPRHQIVQELRFFWRSPRDQLGFDDDFPIGADRPDPALHNRPEFLGRVHQSQCCQTTSQQVLRCSRRDYHEGKIVYPRTVILTARLTLGEFSDSARRLEAIVPT